MVGGSKENRIDQLSHAVMIGEREVLSTVFVADPWWGDLSSCLLNLSGHREIKPANPMVCR
jgi:hypothetical protein